MPSSPGTGTSVTIPSLMGAPDPHHRQGAADLQRDKGRIHGGDLGNRCSTGFAGGSVHEQARAGRRTAAGSADVSTSWLKKKRVLLPLAGVALLTAIGATQPQEPPEPTAAESTPIEDELPRASTTTSERISTATTLPPTTSKAAPTTAPPPPATTAAPVTVAAPTTTVKVQAFVATTAAPPPTTAAPPPTTAAPPTTAGAYYANCDEARAAGAAPIQRGEPGYRAGLDRDNDGTACDK